MEAECADDPLTTPSTAPSPVPTPETPKSPTPGGENVATLALQNVQYRVKYRSGPWWRGACFRKLHVKHVLNDVSMALPAGQLIGLPRSDIARLLDQTALMCQGHVVYYGPTSQLVTYFTKLGFPCPTYANPMDTYIDVVSIDRRDAKRQQATSQRVQELLEAYRNSDLLADTKVKVKEQIRSFVHNNNGFPKASKASWFRKFFTIVKRMNVNLARDRMNFFGRLFLLPLCIPFIVMFLGRLGDSQTSIQDRIGLLYNTVQGPPQVGIINNVALFPALRNHFYREGMDGLYSSATFLLAYALHITPFAIFGGVLFSSIMYWVTGMNPDLDLFWMYVAVVVILHLAGELLAMTVMGLFRDPQLSNTTTTLLFTASGLIASGFLRSLQQMPVFLEIFGWSSILKYASEIVVVNEFHNLNLTCKETLQGVPCLPNGDVFLDANYPGGVEHTARNFQMLASFIVGYLLLAIVMFKVVGVLGTPKSPTPGDENVATLALQDVQYRVKYRSGPWWRGACFRKLHVKHVLNDVNMALPAGQLIGLVGSSGSGKTSLLDVIAFRCEGEVTGTMTYKGVRCTKQTMKQQCSYVIQADRLLPNLTVRETLTYAAYLKLPGYTGKDKIDETVENVINRMGLRTVADSRVGGAVTRGISGGEKRRLTIALQLLKDPVDVISIDRRDAKRQQATSQRVQELLEAYRNSDLLADTKVKVKEQIRCHSFVHNNNGFLRASKPSWFRKFFTIVKRMNVNLARDRKNFLGRLFFFPFFVPFVIMFLGRLGNSQTSIQDRIGLLYNTVQVPPHMAILNNIAMFPALRNHFYREGMDGLYSSATFLLAYALHITPFVIFGGVLFSSIMYWVTGMNPDLDLFGMHVAVVVILHLAGEFLTMAVMGLFRDPQLSNTTTTLLFSASGLIASGFLRSLQQMPQFLKELGWSSILKYASEIVVVNEFHNLNLTCKETIQGLACLPNGDVFLEANYPGAIEHTARNFQVLASFTVGYLLLAVVTFKVVGVRVMQ
nr:hypothetical protein BaRGS_018710 [Batillaria attramentaria]